MIVRHTGPETALEALRKEEGASMKMPVYSSATFSDEHHSAELRYAPPG
jgi:hypothetical protein